MAASIRASLLSALFENTLPLYMSGAASIFVALVAVFRLHQTWAELWLATDIALLLARLVIVRSYVKQNDAEPAHPGRWAARYAPLALSYCLVLGAGTTACMMSSDAMLATSAVMVTAGILGGIASRNAALPRLAMAQVCLGAFPIGLGAALSPHSDVWILVPPLFLYIGGMAAVIRRHYVRLVALMTADQKHAELAAQFDAALTHMPHGLCTIDSAGKVIIANSRTAELFGTTIEMLRLNVSLSEFIGHMALQTFGESLRKQLVERCTQWLSEEPCSLDLPLTDGRHLEMTRNSVPDGSAVIIIEDVTQRRQAEAQVLHLARHDPLTGLPNRRDLCDRLSQKLPRVTHNPKSTLAVMYLDLDGFKQVNDNLGHHAGDEVLTTVAERLKAILHRGESIARLGGDEFAIVLDCATPVTGEALAHRVIQQVSKPYLLSSGTRVTIGTSIGIAFANDNDSFERLLRRADGALYEAKTAGKGTFRFSRDIASENASATEA